MHKKMKKEIVIKSKLLFLCILIFFSVFVLIILYSLEQHFTRFNPEENICEEYKYKEGDDCVFNKTRAHAGYIDNQDEIIGVVHGEVKVLFGTLVCEVSTGNGSGYGIHLDNPCIRFKGEIKNA